jgi:hypothetical protein
MVPILTLSDLGTDAFHTRMKDVRSGEGKILLQRALLVSFVVDTIIVGTVGHLA